MSYTFKYLDCNVCGNSGRKELGKRIPRGFSLDESLITNIVACTTCGLVYPYPMPYPDSDQVIEENFSDPDIFFPIKNHRAGYYHKILNVLEVHLAASEVTFLDVGCGKGELLNSAVQRGWEVFGAEISPSFAGYAAKEFKLKNIRIGNLIDLKYEKKKFDVVSAVSVLGALHNPQEVVLEVNRVLKKGGVFFIEEQNSDSLLYKLGDLFYRFQGKKITTILSPTFNCWQVHGFSSQSISYLLENNGFQIVDCAIKGNVEKDDGNVSKSFLEKGVRRLRYFVMYLAKIIGKGQVLWVCAKKVEDRQ